MRARWILSVVSLLLCAPLAHAQDPAETRAKEHFKGAQAAYNLGQFDKALEGYSAAYAAKALPPFLFNIAQCHKQLGQWERASFFYKRFLTLSADVPDRKKVEELIAQMEQKQTDELAKKAQSEAEAQRQKEQAHTLELERAREATAKAEGEAAAQRAAEAAAAAKLIETAPPEVPLHQRWWLWAGVGAVVAVGAAVTSVAIATRPRSEEASYGQVNAR